MRKQTLFCLLLTAAFYGCGGSQQSATQQTDAKQDVPEDATATTTTTAVVADTAAIGQTDDTLRASLTKAAPVVLEAYTDSLHSTVLCAIQINEPGTLAAEITTQTRKGNIRFSQIYLPDGTTDGPFGQSLTYKLTQPGTFKLRISPSQMANDPYRGNVSVRLNLN